jgi:hypothetical protein
MQCRRAVCIGVVGIGVLGEQRAGCGAIAVAQSRREIAGRGGPRAGGAYSSNEPAKMRAAHG